MKNTEPKYVAKTLAWVNRVRAEHGKKPLKRLLRGYASACWDCPIANSLAVVAAKYKVDVTIERQRYALGDMWEPLPKYVTTFLDAFDKLRLPQYIKPESYHDMSSLKFDNP